MHHAYFVAGDLEEGIAKAEFFIEHTVGLSLSQNPDVIKLQYGLFSVEDARRLRSLAEMVPAAGTQKVITVSVARIFHEAQNALLKLFEETPEGTMLILVLSSEGMLLPTLRSRLQALPQESVGARVVSETAQSFIVAKAVEREKIIAKLIDRTKSDKEEEKQAARLEAIMLAEGLERYAYTKWREGDGSASSLKNKELQEFISDLAVFTPILHERSAPLKFIFEHVVLTMPF